MIIRINTNTNTNVHTQTRTRPAACIISITAEHNNQFSTQLSTYSILLSEHILRLNWRCPVISTWQRGKAKRMQDLVWLLTPPQQKQHKCQQSWLQIVARWHNNAAGAQPLRPPSVCDRPHSGCCTSSTSWSRMQDEGMTVWQGDRVTGCQPSGLVNGPTRRHFSVSIFH